MSYLAPYDGQPLAEAALQRADAYADALGHEVIAFTVVRQDAEFARDRGWLDPGEPFDETRVLAAARADVERLAPDARFEATTVNRWAPAGRVATEIQNRARDLDPAVIFLGSENAGRVATPLSSVGGYVSNDPTYDVHIVRHVGD